MKLDRRALLRHAGIGAGGVFATALLAEVPPPGAQALTPEQFGARGDGVTNDTDAFARLAAAINARGGGEIVLRKTTYLIGRQFRAIGPGRNWSFEPAAILELRRCRNALTIRGNGARLLCAPGLRYGTFDPRSGARTDNAMPFLGTDQRASPYYAMIFVHGCTAPVEISDVELDGGMGRLLLGGDYGDTGRQIPASGLILQDNLHRETLARITSHHHALDGFIIDGADHRAPQHRSRIESVRCDANGRQGCSVVGGRGLDFSDCSFTANGAGRISSSPKAGLDIEAENKRVRDLTFRGCTFASNAGCGLVADSGDSALARFEACTFIGEKSWALWPNKPGFSFDKCRIIGSVANCFGDERQPTRATRFRQCRFLDDPRMASGRQIYGGVNANRPICDLSSARNILFDACEFALTGDSVLPWSTHAIYRNCSMSQRSTKTGYPRGFYDGRNVIRGAVDTYGSKIRGTLTINGQVRSGHDSWP